MIRIKERTALVREDGSPGSFSESLERRARQITKERGDHHRIDYGVAVVERELALVLDHLDHHRAICDQLRHSLVKQERYVNALIRQRRPRGAGYDSEGAPILDPLRNELQEIEHERRRMATLAERERRELFDRVLILLNRHALLHPDHGD